MKSGAIRFLLSGCLWGAWIMDTGGQESSKAECCKYIAAYSPSQLVKIENIQPKPTRTVVEMTADELKRRHPELSTLKFNLDQGSLDLLLKKVGNNIEVFFRDLANISCKEDVLFQITTRKKSISTKKLHREFSYLILPRQMGFPWTEDRADKDGRPVQNNPKFCISKGYAYTCAYIHPDHQKCSSFRCLGRDAKGAYVLAFAQKPEDQDYLTGYVDATSDTAMQFLVQGFVWLNAENCQITRMKTYMLFPSGSLREQTTDICYQETRFDKISQSFWLPKEVTITWSFPTVMCKNQHKYSDFRLFSVETNYKIDKPQAKKPY
jgi:hypothetical protein